MLILLACGQIRNQVKIPPRVLADMPLAMKKSTKSGVLLTSVVQ